MLNITWILIENKTIKVTRFENKNYLVTRMKKILNVLLKISKKFLEVRINLMRFAESFGMCWRTPGWTLWEAVCCRGNDLGDPSYRLGLVSSWGKRDCPSEELQVMLKWLRVLVFEQYTKITAQWRMSKKM